MQHGAPLETFSRLACQSEMALAMLAERLCAQCPSVVLVWLWVAIPVKDLSLRIGGGTRRSTQQI